MKISPKLGSIIVAVVVGGFFAFVSYEGENRLQRSLYAGFVGLALGLTTGYKLLKTIDDKHAQQQIPKEHKEFNYDLWTRISNSIVAIVGFLLGWFIGSKMYPRDSAKEMGVALILSCVFLVVNFIVWKIIEKRAQEHY